MIKVADVTDLFPVDWNAIEAEIAAIQAEPIFSIKHPGQAEWFGDWGGWGITTRDGKHESAFWSGKYTIKDGLVEATGKGELPTYEDTKWSEIATPALRSVVTMVRRKGLYPTRARIAMLMPNSQGPWHVDGSSLHPLHRLHFVVKSNPDARFEAKDRSYYLEPRRAYIFNTDAQHRIVNFGTEVRTHIMMNLNMIKHANKLCEGRYL